MKCILSLIDTVECPTATDGIGFKKDLIPSCDRVGRYMEFHRRLFYCEWSRERLTAVGRY